MAERRREVAADVTTPTTSPSTRIGQSARGGRRPSMAMPTRWRSTPRACSAASAAGPRKSALPQATTQPRPACSGVMPGTELVAVQRQTGLEPQRVAGAEAGRLRRRRRRAPPRARRRPPPARRSRRRPRRCSRCRRRCTATPSTSAWPTRNRPTSAASGQTVARRSLAVGPCTASTARSWVVSRPPTAATTRSVFEAFGITSNARLRRRRGATTR